MDDNDLHQKTELLINSDLPKAYECKWIYYHYHLDALERLCKDSLPKEDYFDLCAQYILEYERMQICLKIKEKQITQHSIEEVHLNLIISPYDYLSPIILTQNQSIIFKIVGKWSMNNQIKDIDYRGSLDSNETYNSFPIGALLGRNSGSPEEGYFKIYNGMRYTPKNTGVLFICFNYDSYSKCECQGQALLTISYTSFNEEIMLYKVMGLDYPDIQKEKNEILKFINMARANPKGFANAFLKHLAKTNIIVASLCEEMSQIDNLEILKGNAFMKHLAEILTADLEKTNRLSHYDSLHRNIKGRAKECLPFTRSVASAKETFNDLSECYTTIQSLTNPSIIVIKMLIDELIPSFENRNCILNPKARYCGIGVSNNILFDHICVITFSEKNYKRLKE